MSAHPTSLPTPPALPEGMSRASRYDAVVIGASAGGVDAVGQLLALSLIPI